MSKRSKADDNSRRLHEEAAAWFLRIHADEVSTKDFAAWRTWLAQSDAHGEAFDGIIAFWGESDRMIDLPWPEERALTRDDYDGDTPLAAPSFESAKPRGRHRSHRILWRLAAAAAFVGFLGILAGYLAPDVFGTRHGVYETATAEHRNVVLADGSHVTLGAKSRITVAYSAARRAVTLHRGEAYFEVAKDKRRAFVVTSGALS
ncbi:MAG: DUF4880 domain-containing protein, partial [Alphaproteobacteria bacterium]